MEGFDWELIEYNIDKLTQLAKTKEVNKHEWKALSYVPFVP